LTRMWKFQWRAKAPAPPRRMPARMPAWQAGSLLYGGGIVAACDRIAGMQHQAVIEGRRHDGSLQHGMSAVIWSSVL
jgi:hypothetical protein